MYLVNKFFFSYLQFKYFNFDYSKSIAFYGCCFFDRFLVTRDYLDNPHKPKTWKVFREKLSIELLFSCPDDKEDIPLN